MCNYCVRKRDLMEDTVLIENAVWELKHGQGDLEGTEIWKWIRFRVSSSSEQSNTCATKSHFFRNRQKTIRREDGSERSHFLVVLWEQCYCGITYLNKLKSLHLSQAWKDIALIFLQGIRKQLTKGHSLSSLSSFQYRRVDFKWVSGIGTSLLLFYLKIGVS